MFFYIVTRVLTLAAGVESFNDLDDTDKLCVIVSGILSCQSLLHHLVKTVFRWFCGPNWSKTVLVALKYSFTTLFLGSPQCQGRGERYRGF